MNKEDKLTRMLKQVVEAASDDPVEQIALVARLAEKRLGYMPREMQAFLALAVGGFGGRDREGLEILAGILGLALANPGMPSKEDIISILNDPRKRLREIADDEFKRHEAQRKEPQLAPDPLSTLPPSVSKKVH